MIRRLFGLVNTLMSVVIFGGVIITSPVWLALWGLNTVEDRLVRWAERRAEETRSVSRRSWEGIQEKTDQ